MPRSTAGSCSRAGGCRELSVRADCLSHVSAMRHHGYRLRAELRWTRGGPSRTGYPRRWPTCALRARAAPSSPRRRRRKSGGPRWGSVAALGRTSSPCDDWGTRATACAVGPHKPAGRFAIVTHSRSAWTAGAVEGLGPSLSALRDAEERLAALSGAGRGSRAS